MKMKLKTFVSLKIFLKVKKMKLQKKKREKLKR
jgi:hypothetical protein